MPISEDEYEDSPATREPRTSTMSKAAIRKSHKPIMEKRRRARINHCLNEIKNLILEAMNKDPARHSKLEKADILEMAVKHLQNVQRQQLAVAMATDPTVIRKFKSGFNDCASEIDKFIGQSDIADNSMRERVSSHLRKCINGLEQVAQFSIPAIGNLPFVSGTGMFPGGPNQEAQSGDQNNNPRIHIPQSIQLIPSRLPTGELALLVPNSSNLPYFPSHALPQRPSAFVTVTPQSGEPPKPPSPPSSPPEPSPKGFRPVQAGGLARPKPSYPGGDHQVPQISSTVTTTTSGDGHRFAAPAEVKTIKFPIHKQLERERKNVGETAPIKRSCEPLCVITNQGERYKRARQNEDSAFFEENLTPQGRGVKRDCGEMLQHQNQGVPATADAFARPNKIVKTSHHVVPSSSFVRSSSDLRVPPPCPFEEDRTPIPYLPISSGNLPESPRKGENFGTVENPAKKSQNPEEARRKDQNEDSNDMWRPW